MEVLLNKIQAAGLDVTAVNGEEAINLWQYIQHHIASNAEEQAFCLSLSADYRAKQQQSLQSAEDLEHALALLHESNHIELKLSIHQSLSQRFIELTHYHQALNHYQIMSQLAAYHGYIDPFVQAVLGMGNLCYAYGDYQRALRYYQKIDALEHIITSRSLRLRYKLHIIACYIQLKRLSDAQQLLDICKQLSPLVDNPTLNGQITLFQQQVYRQHGDVNQAINCVKGIQYMGGHRQSIWLSNRIRIEHAYCLVELNKIPLAILLLTRAEKSLDQLADPSLQQSLYQAFSYIYEQSGDPKQALDYEKKGFQLEAELIRSLPIGELGATQLRRLSRLQPQLKLVLSEQENRELKQTTEHQKTEVAMLQQDALTDPLTQLHNRRWLDRKFKQLLHDELSFALLVIDIDHFKLINDTYSHLIGDQVLSQVSAHLAQYFNFTGTSCVRFGGEEFLVIIEHCSLAQAVSHANTFRTMVTELNWQSILGERCLTVSIGVTLHRDGEHSQRTFYRADKALYKAKANGRNQVCSE